MIKNVNRVRLQSHFANTDWKDTLYIFHSYLSLLSYIFYPLYFFSWLCVLNHEKFILLQVEIKPLQKGGNRRKSLHWFSTYLYDIIKRFCLYLEVWNPQNFKQVTEVKLRTLTMYFVGFTYLVTWVIAEPQTSVRKKSHVFLCPYAKGRNKAGKVRKI